jgi:peptidoglycan hydrolase-like protein with peptidoglycan-binding domain
MALPTSNAADIEAINNFFQRTTANTPAAKQDKAEWNTWYNNLGFFDKRFDASVANASVRRDRFNVHNGTPPIPSIPLTKEEEAWVMSLPVTDVTGMTPEQAKAAVAKHPLTTNSPLLKAQPKGSTSGKPTIKEGSKGDAVKEWQGIVGTKADGNFGPNTTKLTKAWQSAHSLKADGIVGPGTWSAAYGSGITPTQVAVATAIAKPPSTVHPATVSKPVTIPTASKPPTAAFPDASAAISSPKIIGKIGLAAGAVLAVVIALVVGAKSAVSKQNKELNSRRHY